MDRLKPGGATPRHVYLAGAIEYAPDNGRQWRAEISRFLREQLNLEVFDPCERETAVMNEEERAGFRQWKSDDRARFLPVIRRIIDADLDNLLHHTDFVICLWDEHVMGGAGTAGELTLAYRAGIPVYLVTPLPLSRVSSWVLGCATQVFRDFDELRAYLAEMTGREPCADCGGY